MPMKSPTKQRYRVLDLVPQVILLRAEGKSLNEIASLMNLTKQRICQVVQIAKRHEAIQARWGFPFSVRTDRILEDLAVKSKDDALQLYRTGHLFPGAIWSFGHRSYREICEWLGVEPLKKRPKVDKQLCQHCGKPIFSA
jgi:hypothetical protein